MPPATIAWLKAMALLVASPMSRPKAGTIFWANETSSSSEVGRPSMDSESSSMEALATSSEMPMFAMMCGKFLSVSRRPMAEPMEPVTAPIADWAMPDMTPPMAILDAVRPLVMPPPRLMPRAWPALVSWLPATDANMLPTLDAAVRMPLVTWLPREDSAELAELAAFEAMEASPPVMPPALERNDDANPLPPLAPAPLSASAAWSAMPEKALPDLRELRTAELNLSIDGMSVTYAVPTSVATGSPPRVGKHGVYELEVGRLGAGRVGADLGGRRHGLRPVGALCPVLGEHPREVADGVLHTREDVGLVGPLERGAEGAHAARLPWQLRRQGCEPQDLLGGLVAVEVVPEVVEVELVGLLEVGKQLVGVACPQGRERR